MLCHFISLPICRIPSWIRLTILTVLAQPQKTTNESFQQRFLILFAKPHQQNTSSLKQTQALPTAGPITAKFCVSCIQGASQLIQRDKENALSASNTSACSQTQPGTGIHHSKKKDLEQIFLVQMPVYWKQENEDQQSHYNHIVNITLATYLHFKNRTPNNC